MFQHYAPLSYALTRALPSISRHSPKVQLEPASGSLKLRLLTEALWYQIGGHACLRPYYYNCYYYNNNYYYYYYY